MTGETLPALLSSDESPSAHIHFHQNYSLNTALGPGRLPRRDAGPGPRSSTTPAEECRLYFPGPASGGGSSTARRINWNPKSLRGTARNGLRASDQNPSSCGAGSKSATAY